MSFIIKLLSKKKPVQQQEQKVTDLLYTQYDDGFVNIYRSTSDLATEEEADVSRWEMAKILGAHRSSVVTTSDIAQTKSLNGIRETGSRLCKLSNKMKPSDLSDEPPMDDSLELDMYDDKRNRIIKRSNRRKLNFESKIRY